LKKILFAIVLLIVACNEAQQPVTPPSKKIIKKKEAVGSHYNILTEKQVIETEYYLIAEDGTFVKVPIGFYTMTEEGDVITSPNWQR
jgi:hypothetical protein